MRQPSHQENWKPVLGYEDLYEISDMGRLRSVDGWVNSNGGNRFRKGQIIKTWLWNGYERVHLCKDNKRKTASIHRLVGEAFLPNPDGKPAINHRNGIKSDNRMENLEWCTHQENLVHALNTGLRDGLKVAKRVLDTCTHTTYRSIGEAALALGISYHQCRRWIQAGRCLELAA